MIEALKFLFLPHQSNNQKAKVLHLSSLTFLIILIGIFQLGLTFLTKWKPGILGFASNINPEKLIEMTNQYRKEQGLGSLQINSNLVEAARQKASEMFTFGCWSHNCNNRSPWWFFKNVGYNYLYAGENLAKDFGESEAVVTAWMNSATHRDNILNGKYKEIGIAVVDGILNGEETTLVVQMFGTQAQPSSLLTMGEQTMVETPKQVVPVPEQITKQEVKKELKPEVMISQAKEEKKPPLVSSFTLTKIFYLLLISLMVVIMAVDSLMIYQNQIIRISGKSFIHLSFFIIILISILLSYQGKIL